VAVVADLRRSDGNRHHNTIGVVLPRGQEQTYVRGKRSTQCLAECVLKLTEPVSSLRYQSAIGEFQQGKQK
jgi:hypothetical protein